jgi:hypothetical protein
MYANAYLTLQNISSQKSYRDTLPSTLLANVNIRNDLAYKQTINQYQNQVTNQLRKAKLFTSYKQSSIKQVAYYSSLYEDALIDITRNKNLLTQYSSLYESSIIGSSSIYGQYTSDVAKSKEIEITIRLLRREYEQYQSSYSNYTAISTSMIPVIKKAKDDISYYSSIYVSTTTGIQAMNGLIDDLNYSILVSSAQLFAQSSILNTEIINLASYNAQILDSVNSQELSAYQYRETFCRSKCMDVQEQYESQILGAIQLAASTDATIAASGVKALATPVNLASPPIQATYNSLTTINSFLDTFYTVYTPYNIQTRNIQNLRTSIGYEMSSWSTFNNYSQKAYFSSLQMPPTVVDDFVKKQQRVAENLSIVKTQSQAIAGVKQTFATKYMGFFSPAEIQQQDTTISSFIIQGLTVAS